MDLKEFINEISKNYVVDLVDGDVVLVPYDHTTHEVIRNSQ